MLDAQPVKCQGYGQEYPVGISVIVMPPYTPYINDYIGDPDKTIVTATNYTDSALTVLFGGNITNNENISIYTDIDHQPFHLVTIMPNSTFRMTLNNIQEVFSADQLVYQGITGEEIIQDQNLPEGNYWICITAYDPYTKMPLSHEGQGCSNVITITVPGVALIIEPACGANLIPTMPQSVSFSWIVPENAPMNTHYTLKINEIFPGENKNDAMAPYHPTFFETTVMTTSYQYGPAEPPLVAGKHYAFAIISSDPEGNIIFENNGWSEICEFTYGSTIVWTPPDTTQLGHIILLFPGEADTVSANPAFHWEVTGIQPDHYEIRVFKMLPGQTKEQAVLNSPMLSATTTTTTYSFPCETCYMQCHYYCWTVTGYTYSGSYSTTSTLSSFHYVDPYQICPYPCYCSPTKDWHKGPAIKVVRQIDYFPEKNVMEPGEVIAFSVLATDKDLLLYKCYELGSTWEKQFEIADRVNYSWNIEETGPVSPVTVVPAVSVTGPVNLTWQPFLTSFNTIKYNLPVTPLLKGETKVVTAKCTISSNLDDAITGKVQIVLVGRDDGCFDVSFTLTPVIEAGSITLTLPVGTCDPGCIPDKFTGLSATMDVGKNLCAGELSILRASCSDMDKFIMTCTSGQGCVNPPPLEVILADPLSLSWSDCGAGGTFPLGKEGPCVAYVAPQGKSDIVIQVTANNLIVDDGGVVFEDRGSGCRVDLTIHKPPVIDKNQPAVPEDDEICKGAQTFVNLDNDDQDGKFDIDDSPVRDDNNVTDPDKIEDEMVKLIITIEPEAAAGTVKLTATKGADCIRIWAKNTKEDEYKPGDELKMEKKDGKLKKELWVEGIKPHTEQRGTILKVIYTENGATCEDEVALTIIGIEKIEWLGKGNSENNDNNLLTDPNQKNPDGSLMTTRASRVFPDARNVGGAVEANPRHNVEIKVTLSVKPIEPLDIYFKSFDVDDPSKNNAPVDDENREYDNRGPLPGGNGSGLFMTTGKDNTGQSFDDKEKTFGFQVTMQPGDNFRVAGNGDQDFINDLENNDRELNKKHKNDDKQRICNKFIRENNTAADPEKWEILFPSSYASLTLTVWRFLHIEMESMDAAAGNLISGRITNVVNNGNGTCTITTNQNFNEPGAPMEGDNRFQNGRLVNLASAYSVISNAHGPNFTITVVNITYIPVIGNFTMVDKDGGNEIKGKITNVIDNGDGTSTAITDQNYSEPGSPNQGDGRFIDGNLLNNNLEFIVTNNTHGPNFSIILENIIYTPVIGDFTLVDDDDFNQDDGIKLVGDDGEDIYNPDIRYLQGTDDIDCSDNFCNLFVNVYIIPKYDLSDNESSFVAYVLNTPDTPAGFDSNNPVQEGILLRATYDFDWVGQEANVNYWTIYLLGAYQMQTEEDGDGTQLSHGVIVNESITAGQVDALNGQGASVFLESAREWPGVPDIGKVTIHEICHLFNSVHSDGEIMDGNVFTLILSDVTISKIRSINHP